MSHAARQPRSWLIFDVRQKAMPSKSLAFSKIRSDALSALHAVPVGRVTTFSEVGRVLEVMPRHIAYIIATLTQQERLTVPWHRIVSEGGVLSKQQIASHGRAHVERLRKEGVLFTSNGQVVDWKGVEWRWKRTATKVGGKSRGPYSDPTTPLLFPAK